MKCPFYKIFYGLLPLFLFFSLFCFSTSVFATSYQVDYNSKSDIPTSTNLIPQLSFTPKYLFIYCDNFNPSDSYLDLFMGFTNFSINSNNNLGFRCASNGRVAYSSSTATRYSVRPSYSLILSSTPTGAGDASVHFIFSDEDSPCPPSPSGSLSITENGTYDVTNYAEAVVNVPESSGGGSGGDYHDDLAAINNSILICAAVCLVIYFFYCIYRMIIKSNGGWR